MRFTIPQSASDFRVPCVWWGLQGAAFGDIGGLFLRSCGVSLGRVRESAGPGLRYQTLIGGISLDYGFKLYRPRRESIGEIHFTIGNLF